MSVSQTWLTPRRYQSELNLITHGGKRSILTSRSQGSKLFPFAPSPLWGSVVAVRALGFSAECVCDSRDEELQVFLADLESALAKLGQPTTINFCTLERGITFEINMNRSEHVDGKYEFARDWCGPFLSGCFTADQTHLREIGTFALIEPVAGRRTSGVATLAKCIHRGGSSRLSFR